MCYTATVLIAGLERWLGLYCPYIGIAGVILYIYMYASHPLTHMYMGNSHICWPAYGAGDYPGNWICNVVLYYYIVDIDLVYSKK